MTNKNTPTLPVIMLITGLLLSSAPAGDEFAVFPSFDDQEAPDVHGAIVVWQQFVNEYGDYDIYIADVGNPDDPNIIIIGDANDQMAPAIFEDTVVWQDNIFWDGSFDWDIRMADIADQADPQVFAVSDIFNNDEQKPAIHGNIVVWQDGAPGNFDIYGADITDPSYPTEFVVSYVEMNQEAPAIYRTTVTWDDDYSGQWDIYSADIWQRNKPTESPVCWLDWNQKNSAISGETVVWQDDYFGDWDIFAADISDPENPIEFPIAANSSSQENPDIDGNLVVWQDNRHGNWDIFGYNLTTRQEFRITDDPHDQINPAISGDLVVWQDSRDGPSNIYAVRLAGPDIARCSEKIPGDVNNDCRVDFTDFNLMAANWLECNLDPCQTKQIDKQMNIYSSSSTTKLLSQRKQSLADKPSPLRKLSVSRRGESTL